MFHTPSSRIRPPREFGSRVHYLLDPENKSKSGKLASVTSRGIQLRREISEVYFVLAFGRVTTAKYTTFDENAFLHMRLFSNIAIAERKSSGSRGENKENWNFNDPDLDSGHGSNVGGFFPDHKAMRARG